MFVGTYIIWYKTQVIKFLWYKSRIIRITTTTVTDNNALLNIFGNQIKPNTSGSNHNHISEPLKDNPKNVSLYKTYGTVAI